MARYKKAKIVLIRTHIKEDRMLAYSGAKVQSRFYPGDLVTRTGDREICSVSMALSLIHI